MSKTDADGIVLVTWDTPGRSMNVLEIGEGELIVLLGPSGSGKSTLLNHYSVGRYDMAPTLLSKIIPQRSAYSASR